MNIYKIVGQNMYDFTDYCGEITLRSDSEELAEELNFEVKGTQITVGDIITLYDGSNKIFEGIAVDITQTEFVKTVTCFDFAWYLNKNENVIQFNYSVSKAIEKMCTENGITIGAITPINVVYKKIVKGSLAKIIEDLLQYATSATGAKYIFYMRGNKFYCLPQETTTVILNTDAFIQTLNITNLAESPSVKYSIGEMYNMVKVTSQSDNKVTTLALKQDVESIKKYGRLQKVESVGDKEKKSAGLVAANALKQLNRVSKKLNVTLPGNIDCRAHKLLEFNNGFVTGVFEIKKCNHVFSSTGHIMQLELEGI